MQMNKRLGHFTWLKLDYTNGVCVAVAGAGFSYGNDRPECGEIQFI
jgi:hypothetical protein